MILSNIEEVISLLRSKFPEYLAKKGIFNGEPGKMFRCFLHDDSSPSMHLNPKANFEAATCFGCMKSADIFSAAAHLDGLPSSGPGWIQETIPHLAEYLEIPVALGEPSEHEILRSKFFSLARDIADIIQHPANVADAYIKERQWANSVEDCYSVDFEKVMAHLAEKGWTRDIIYGMKMITYGATDTPLIGKKQITWVIKDHRGRPVAFISRQLDRDPKYVHSAESPIFLKREILYGLDFAKPLAKKRQPLTIVEGPGDRFSLLHHEIKCTVALCGVALTEHHLNNLKSLGISELALCLDWDEAGQQAIERLASLLHTKKIQGFNIDVICPVQGYKDIDEYLKDGNSPHDLTVISLFEWLITRTNLDNAEEVSLRLIPVIAASPTAIKRDMLARRLCELTGITHAAILTDVDRLRNNAYEEKKERILAATDKYRAAVESDPTNVQAAFATHESEISNIEAEYEKDTFGANYQLARFDAIQELKKDTSVDRSAFEMNTYTNFKDALSDGMTWASGTLIYFGGRENSGKTACMCAMALDVAISDPDTIVIFHFTDDAYAVVEPRIITNIAYLLTQKQKLSIGEAGCPAKGFHSSETSALYSQAATFFRGLLGEERMMIIDSEDGSNLSATEKALKHMRRKYPKKKILVVIDNTYNLSDFPHLDQTPRIARIADIQKKLTIKYQCCMFASAEYCKEKRDPRKIQFPTNEDLADSRALKYRASIIIHVYNDVNDRGDYAEVYWNDPMDPEMPKPRLMLLFGKNKVGGFKHKLIMDLNPRTVCLAPISWENARADIDQMLGKGMRIEKGRLIVNTEYEGEKN